MPFNGTVSYLEHWWCKDISNVRIISLDSNPNYRVPDNWIGWMVFVFNVIDMIDFVFAQLHHPHQSELWPIGNTDFTGDHSGVRAIYRIWRQTIHSFLGIPFIQGQLRDHQHLMVNVTSAGGNIDYWDEYAQIDYPEYTISTGITAM